MVKAVKYRPLYMRTLEAALAKLPAGPSGTPARPLAAVPARLLLVKAIGLGDSVLIRSIAEYLRALHPALQIGVLVCPPCREVMSCNSDFRIHCYEPRKDGLAGIASTLRDVRRARYDAAIDFEPWSLLSVLMVWAAGVPIRIGFRPPVHNPRARLLTHGISIDAGKTIWENFLQLARLVEPSLREKLVTRPIPCAARDEEWAAKWWEKQFGEASLKVVAIHLGSGDRGAFKRWPVSRFSELAERVRKLAPQLAIVTTGTVSDQALIDEFRGLYRGKIVEASDLGSVQKTALLLKRCDLLVSNDTGVMHVGAAMGTPTVGLFGPTQAHWQPAGSRATYVFESREACSPCVDTYRGVMPAACFNPIERKCMLDISVEAVIAAAKRVIHGDWLSAVSGCADADHHAPAPQ